MIEWYEEKLKNMFEFIIIFNKIMVDKLLNLKIISCLCWFNLNIKIFVIFSNNLALFVKV